MHHENHNSWRFCAGVCIRYERFSVRSTQIFFWKIFQRTPFYSVAPHFQYFSEWWIEHWRTGSQIVLRYPQFFSNLVGGARELENYITSFISESTCFFGPGTVWKWFPFESESWMAYELNRYPPPPNTVQRKTYFLTELRALLMGFEIKPRRLSWSASRRVS